MKGGTGMIETTNVEKSAGTEDLEPGRQVKHLEELQHGMPNPRMAAPTAQPQRGGVLSLQVTARYRRVAPQLQTMHRARYKARDWPADFPCHGLSSRPLPGQDRLRADAPTCVLGPARTRTPEGLGLGRPSTAPTAPPSSE